MEKLVVALEELIQISEQWYDQVSDAVYEEEDEAITPERLSKWAVGIEDDISRQLSTILALLTNK